MAQKPLKLEEYYPLLYSDSLSKGESEAESIPHFVRESDERKKHLDSERN